MRLSDGQAFLTVGGDDGTVRFWDTALGTERTRCVVGGPMHALASVPATKTSPAPLAVAGPAGIATIVAWHGGEDGEGTAP
ncbi:hypothetical protein [Lentzea nigeriaca]|uniref:hypothetical protein n=1 Tax=Lentzea nigeriaca TaxID=1128665 RepID=UPI00195E8709|nr:hypothetical protein [Lentzea nigeriaca]MBM7864596.1 WD40 repeat protein [Lentzea nigeriaca]